MYYIILETWPILFTHGRNLVLYMPHGKIFFYQPLIAVELVDKEIFSDSLKLALLGQIYWNQSVRVCLLLTSFKFQVIFEQYKCDHANFLEIQVI